MNQNFKLTNLSKTGKLTFSNFRNLPSQKARFFMFPLWILFFLGFVQFGMSHNLHSPFNGSSTMAFKHAAIQTQISNLESQHIEEINRLNKVNKTTNIVLISVMTILLVSLILIFVLYSKKKSRSKEFENLNALKDMIFQVIAHDLRSPLYNFRTLLKMAENKYLEKDEYEAYLKTIQQELNGITSVTESLLRWAQTSQKKLTIKKQKIGVRKICQDVKETFKYDLDEKEIELESNFSDDFTIDTDPDLFSFILRNLVQNAIKFSYPKSRIDAKVSQTDKAVNIEIIDHGKGMSNEQLENINAKISNPGRDVTGFKSSGLGMIICQDFANKLGIKMSVSSILEKGTTFKLQIPKKK